MSNTKNPQHSHPSTSAPIMPVPNDYDSAIQALAASIYIQLVKDAVVISTADGNASASIKANPESLAKISFKLAEAFLETNAAIKASAKPKTVAFDVNKMDFGS